MFFNKRINKNVAGPELPEFNNEVEVLVQRFPSLEENALREILEQNNGHSGKTTRQIFKEYSEDPVVEESKREFEMKFLKPNIWSYITSCSGVEKVRVVEKILAVLQLI